jgi:hypothetical protein
MIEATEIILEDIETIIATIEIFLASSEVISSWEEEDYFAAGYQTGNGGFGLLALIDDVMTQYSELTA